MLRPRRWWPCRRQGPAGVHLVNGDDAQVVEERARRADVLQRAENEFDPIPLETEAARAFGASAPQFRPAVALPGAE